MSGNPSVKLPGFLKTLTEASKAPLKASLTISRPIGLPEPKVFGSQFSITKYFSPEARDQRRQQINYDLKHSQVYEYKSYTNTNGKIFRSPVSFFKGEKSLYFPNFIEKNINGERIEFFKALAGKVNVIRVFQSVAGANATETYFKSGELDYLTKNYKDFVQKFPKVQLIDLNIPLDSLKNTILNMSKSNIKKSVPEERQLGYFILPHSVFNHEVRENLLCDNNYGGYIYVVDEQGRIRWCTSGNSDEADVKLFHKVLMGLSKEISV